MDPCIYLRGELGGEGALSDLGTGVFQWHVQGREDSARRPASMTFWQPNLDSRSGYIMNDGMNTAMKGLVILAQAPSREQSLHSSTDTLAASES